MPISMRMAPYGDGLVGLVYGLGFDEGARKLLVEFADWRGVRFDVGQRLMLAASTYRGLNRLAEGVCDRRGSARDHLANLPRFRSAMPPVGVVAWASGRWADFVAVAEDGLDADGLAEALKAQGEGRYCWIITIPSVNGVFAATDPANFPEVLAIPGVAAARPSRRFRLRGNVRDPDEANPKAKPKARV